MPIQHFQFYRTFVPALHKLRDPVVLSFDNTSFAKACAHDSEGAPRHFIHSGNFFSQPYVKKPELRTRDRVLRLQESLLNDNTDGLMTVNVPANGDDNLWVPYWNQAKADRMKAVEESLEHALWARDNAQKPDILYAGFEVGTYRDARVIFDRALKADLNNLSAGFGLFSRFAQYRLEDRLRQFEVLTAYKELSGEVANTRFHASGGSALNVLELLAFANVTSADGSSAVIAGLAYGSVLNQSGRTVRANKLTEWTCKCAFCEKFDPGDALFALKRSGEARVQHNVHTLRLSEARINDALANNTIAELVEERLSYYDNKALWKCLSMLKQAG